MAFAVLPYLFKEIIMRNPQKAGSFLLNLTTGRVLPRVSKRSIDPETPKPLN